MAANGRRTLTKRSTHQLVAEVKYVRYLFAFKRVYYDLLNNCHNQEAAVSTRKKLAKIKQKLEHYKNFNILSFDQVSDDDENVENANYYISSDPMEEINLDFDFEDEDLNMTPDTIENLDLQYEKLPAWRWPGEDDDSEKSKDLFTNSQSSSPVNTSPPSPIMPRKSQKEDSDEEMDDTNWISKNQAALNDTVPYFSSDSSDSQAY